MREKYIAVRNQFTPTSIPGAFLEELCVKENKPWQQLYFVLATRPNLIPLLVEYLDRRYEVTIITKENKIIKVL